MIHRPSTVIQSTAFIFVRRHATLLGHDLHYYHENRTLSNDPHPTYLAVTT
jgi:hypothetical protein